MNNSSNNVIKRQWLIIQYLIKSNYVSTTDVQNYLKSKGLEAKLRTIQRDLVQLEELFPIESRKDDKPYSWRWMRLNNTSISQLSLTQAVVLRLVEKELEGVIPSDLYESLQPLFVKANMVVGLSQIAGLDDIEQNLAVDSEQDISNVFNKEGEGFYPIPPWKRILMRLRAQYLHLKKINSSTKIEHLNESDIQLLLDRLEGNEEQDKDSLIKLKRFLRDNGFDEVAGCFDFDDLKF